MKNVTRNAGYWIGGTLTALAGVLLARMAPVHAAPPLRLPLTVGGQLLALFGLLVICVGVSRRLKRDASSNETRSIQS